MTHEDSHCPIHLGPLRRQAVLAVSTMLWIACGDSTSRAPGRNSTGSGSAAQPAGAPTRGGDVPSRDTGVVVTRPDLAKPFGLVLGATTMRLNASTIRQAEASLGPAIVSRTVHPQEGHGEFKTEACYLVGSGREQSTARFFAEEESEDATMTIYRAVIADAASPLAPADTACRPVPDASMHWTNELRLGMTRAHVERGLGPPERIEDGDAVYEYEDHKVPWPYRDSKTGEKGIEILFVMIRLRIRYEQDLAVRIEASRHSEPNQ